LFYPSWLCLFVLKARAKNLDELGRETGSVYSINNLGAILGSFSAGFIFIPILGVKATNIVAAALNMAVALIILFFSPSSRIRGTGIVCIVVLFSFLFLNIPYHSNPYNFYKAYRFPSYKEFEEYTEWKRALFEKEGVQGLIQVFYDTNDNTLEMVNNGKVEGNVTRVGNDVGGGTSIDWANQLLLAYLPLEANSGARSFLNIGLGTGTTLRAAMSDIGLREIDCIEINPVVLEAVRGYFYPELFNDPRINFIIADARNYLLLVPKRYDIISSEPSYPVDQGISHLFSLEFFELVKSRLSERGVFAQWLPGYLLSDKDKKIMIRTFGSVFPNTYVWHVVNSDDIILIGSVSSVPLPGDIFERIEKREKAEGLWRYYRLWLNPDDVKRIVAKGGLINTDDWPFIEFAASRNMLGGK
jgi:spermidine synthase